MSQICLTAKSESDRAHNDCLQRIGLADGPRSTKQRDEYEENVFWPNIKKIVNNAYLELHSNGHLDVDNPTNALLEHLYKNIPIKQPSGVAVEKMTEIVSKITHGFD